MQKKQKSGGEGDINKLIQQAESDKEDYCINEEQGEDDQFEEEEGASEEEGVGIFKEDIDTI